MKATHILQEGCGFKSQCRRKIDHINFTSEVESYIDVSLTNNHPRCKFRYKFNLCLLFFKAKTFIVMEIIWKKFHRNSRPTSKCKISSQLTDRLNTIRIVLLLSRKVFFIMNRLFYKSNHAQFIFSRYSCTKKVDIFYGTPYSVIETKKKFLHKLIINSWVRWDHNAYWLL